MTKLNHNMPVAPVDARAQALRDVLIDKGLISEEYIQKWKGIFEEWIPENGAKVVARVPQTGGGAFGAARLAAIVERLQARLMPGQGKRPGRPTDCGRDSVPRPQPHLSCVPAVR